MKILEKRKKISVACRTGAVVVAVVFAAAVAPSCDGDRDYGLTLSVDTLYSRARGDTAILTVRPAGGSGSAPFEVSGKPEWVTVEAIDAATLRIIFDPNPLKTARYGEIVLTQQAAGGASVTVNLTQNALVTRHVWKQASIPTDAGTGIVAYVNGDPNTVFCIIGSGSRNSYLYKSADGGKNWELVNDRMDFESLFVIQYRFHGGWMNWSSPTHGTLIRTDLTNANMPWYIAETFDGGITWETTAKREKLRYITVSADNGQPAFMSTESFDYPMGSMLISPDRDWSTALRVMWRNRFGNSNTGYVAADYTYVGCSNGEFWRAATADLFQQDTTELAPESIAMTRFEITLPDGEAVISLRGLQEAGGALYCMAFRSDKRMFVMKSADKGEHWTFHAEVASESTPSRTVPQEGFTLKVFDDGRSLVVGYNYLYVFTSGGDIAERIPPPEGSGSYPYVYRNISYSYSEYFAAYDTERMVCHLKGNGQFYLTEEAEEE